MSMYFRNRVIKLILHTDLDGKSPKFIAEYINKFLLEDKKIVVNAVFVNNNEMDEVIYEEILKEINVRVSDSIYIIDISPSSQKTVDLIEEFNCKFGDRVKLFDHHKTSEFLKDYSWVHHDSSICGTQIFWNYIQEDVACEIPTPEFLKLDRYVTYVDDWDTWKWKNTDKYKDVQYPIPAVLNNALNSLGYNIFETIVSDVLMSANSLDYSFPDLEQLYKLKYEYNRQFALNVTTQIGEHTLIRVNGHEIPFFKKEDEQYRVGIIYSDKEDVSNYATMILDADSVYLDALLVLSLDHISFRRHKDSRINIVDVCKSLNGGGHPDACGCGRNENSEEIYKFYFQKVLKTYQTN